MSLVEQALAPTINASQIYNEELLNLSKSRKKDLTKDLYSLINNLNEKKNINDFIESKIDMLGNVKIFYSELDNKKSKFTLFFLVKIVGFLFLTSHIIGTYQLIGIKSSLEEEVFDSIKMYFNGNTTNNTINFYQKVYSNNTKKLPGLSFFFLLAFLSGLISKLISFPIITIIILILNSVVFYFLYNFNFREGEKLNENYDTFNFTLLILYNIYFSIILGISALLPMEIFFAGYFYYEQKLAIDLKAKGDNFLNIIEKKDINKIDISKNEKFYLIIDDTKKDNKNKKKVKNISIIQSCSEDNENIKKENISDIYVRDSSSFFLEINDLKTGKKIKEPEKIPIVVQKYNGYLISYLLAFLIAITVRLFSNSENIITEHKYLYINLIKFHVIPIIISSFFYLIFSCAFTKKTEKESEICITQFCGYLLFQETKERKKSICCGGCRAGFRMFNIVVCKIMCCGNFFCNCCECDTCCPCLPISNCCKEKDDLTDLNDRENSLCLCYKISGKCTWVCSYFSNIMTITSAIYLTFIELYNFGFKSLLNEYIADLDYKRNYSDPEASKIINIIHIVYIVGVIFFYFLNLLSGRILYSQMFSKKNELYNETYIIGSGIMIIILFESIISCIFSSIIYYEYVDDYKYYLMAFSISSAEYIKLQLLNIMAKGDLKSQLFGISTFIAIFLFIERAILSMLDNFVDDHMDFIFFQFIFGIISGFFGLCFVGCACCLNCIIKKAQELIPEENLTEEWEEQNIEIEERKEEKIPYGKIEI